MSELSESPNATPFVIRNATLDEIPALALLQDRAIAQNLGLPLPTAENHDPRHATTITEYMSRPDTWCHVATFDKQVVGFALGYPAAQEAGLQPNPLPNELMEHLSFLMVEPTMWGRSIGRLLLRTVDETAKERDRRWVSLWSAIDNTRAQRLYERHGYARSGRTRTLARWGEQVHYLRDLRAC